jgi:hypothetical protein
MAAMFELLVLAFFLGATFFMCAEVYFERSWPRESFKFFAISLVCILFFFTR